MSTDRDQRRAEALRANLRRRKSWQKGQQQERPQDQTLGKPHGGESRDATEAGGDIATHQPPQENE